MKRLGHFFEPAYRKAACVLFLLVTALHIVSWYSRAFTDWYRIHIFPIWTGTLGRISGSFSGSVGEVLIVVGVGYVLLGLCLLLTAIFGSSIRRARQKVRGRQGIRRACGWYRRGLCWILLYIYVTETLNCFIMYHASTVEEQFYEESAGYGAQELAEVYTQVVTRANALAGQVSRDADGQAVYPGTQDKLYAACKEAMKAQGSSCPYLAGFYPDPKPIRASHFMSQQYLLGIYFPFTMEANYNAVMYPVNVPVTVCHEYSHLKGVILEDEANFFAFAACVGSDDPYLQYSGYLSVLGYLTRQVRKSVPEEIRKQLPAASSQVKQDDVFLTEDTWEEVEKKAVVSTETVDKATDVFLDKNLTLNGVSDGIQSYGRVVRLVICYYRYGAPALG